MFQHAMDDREKEHQKIYLEMYKRGQDSARFEREEEVSMFTDCRIRCSSYQFR